MKKLELFILIFAVLLIGVSNSHAQKMKEKVNDKDVVFNHLNLTDAQKENFTKIKFAKEKVKIELEAELKMNRLEIKKLLNEINFDESKLLNLVESGSKINYELKKANVEMWLKIRNILNDDQKKLWIKHFNKMDRRKNKFFNKEKKNNLINGKNNYHKRMNRNNIIDKNTSEG